jgi:tetratricopeptide (TPR) repeat protein
MRRLTSSLSALAAIALIATGGCGTAPKGGAEPVEPVIVRPVVVAERGGEEVVAALALLKEGNFRQAEANLEEILKVRADIPEAHFNLGWVKHQLKKYAEAIVQLQNGLRLRPGEVRAYNLMALSQRELGQFAEAEATYAKALAITPDSDRLHLNLGILYDLYLLKPEAALEHYRRYQALQKTPDTKVAGWITVLERKKAQ